MSQKNLSDILDQQSYHLSDGAAAAGSGAGAAGGSQGGAKEEQEEVRVRSKHYPVYVSVSRSLK